MIFLLFCILLLPFELQASAYVDNKQCLSCHKKQAKQWKKSDHYFSMLKATPDTVKGDFKQKKIVFDNVTVTFYKKGARYKIKECKLDKNKKTHCQHYNVSHTFGYSPLQQYLIDFPNGAKQVYPVAWDTKDNQFFHLQNKYERQNNSPVHWTKKFYNWNHSCADCHSTNYQKNYRQGRYNSQYSGVNVNCQACHGPGQGHLKWLNNKMVKNKGFVIDIKKQAAKTTMQQCAQCHSRRAKLVDQHAFNAPFNDDYRLSLLRPDLYHPDGQTKDEVFVYGSFIQSKMYQSGVSCLDCHNVHSTELKVSGNGLCVQCHNVVGRQKYPTLKKKNYNHISHTHHKKNSAGSQCVACHMPSTTYMGVDQRADHKIFIPNPNNTLRYGTPNACNRCHKDKTAQWSLDALSSWGVTPINTFNAKADSSQLLDFLKDKTLPEIYRATSLYMLVKNHQASGSLKKSWVSAGLNDKDYLVKRTALELSQYFNDLAMKQKIKPLLGDANRYLRGQAAFSLAGNDSSAEYKAAKKTYQSIQKNNLDTAEGWINLAMLKLKQGKFNAGIKTLKQAINVSSHAIKAHLILSQLYQQRGQTKKAITTLSAGVKHNPDVVALLYPLALAYADAKQFPLAENVLATILRISPLHVAAIYNLSLIELKLGKKEKAQYRVKQALKYLPSNQRLLQLEHYFNKLKTSE